MAKFQQNILNCKFYTNQFTDVDRLTAEYHNDVNLVSIQESDILIL